MTRVKNEPVSRTAITWLKANLGRDALAPLTGTDYKALQAAAHIIELYSYDGDPSVLLAFAHVVMRMQPSTRELAYHAIAHVMDWHNRLDVWSLAHLPPLGRVRRCEHEP